MNADETQIKKDGSPAKPAMKQICVHRCSSAVSAFFVSSCLGGKTLCDSIQNRSIRGGKFERCEYRSSNPAERFARWANRIDGSAVEEVQLDAVVRVIVLDGGVLDGNLNRDAGFFETFSCGGVFGRFAGLQLAAGKFPQSGQRHVRRSLAD